VTSFTGMMGMSNNDRVAMAEALPTTADVHKDVVKDDKHKNINWSGISMKCLLYNIMIMINVMSSIIY